MHTIKNHKIYQSLTNVHKPFIIPGLPQPIDTTKAKAPPFFYEETPWFEKLAKETIMADDGIVLNTCSEMESYFTQQLEELTGKKVYAIGPLPLANKDAASKAARGNKPPIDESQCLQWLDSMPESSVVYLSFGSITHTAAAQLIEIGAGSEASGLRFIWVIKESELMAAPEVGKWLTEEEGFEKRVEGKGMVIKGWAPHAAILGHPAEDVKLMSDTGLEAYKFSISWSRLIPNGRGEVNRKGLDYYNNLINELIGKGIQPHVMLYHQDLPQALEDEYHGWLSPIIVDDFTAYADVCFREFGDRVSHWTTIAEVNIMSTASYDIGVFPPQRCSYPFGVNNCTAGNSSTEPYIVIHNALLAHASIFHLYKTKYKAFQHGWIGLNTYTSWYSPFSDSKADVKATKRARDFMLGWIVDPLVFGDYPKTMKKIVGSRLPVITKSQSEYLKGSFDFIGLNHYISAFVADNSAEALAMPIRDYNNDMLAISTVSKNETPSGKFVPTSTPYQPDGLRKMLEYIKQKYKNPPIYIQENGCGLGMEDTINDTYRIDYLNGYIGSTLEAIRNGANVRGYFVWSFMDVFELLDGYRSRFGLYFVDFDDKKHKRIPKASAHWYSNFLKGKNIKELQGVHSVALDFDSK